MFLHGIIVVACPPCLHTAPYFQFDTGSIFLFCTSIYAVDDATPTTTICSEPNPRSADIAHHIVTEQNSAYVVSTEVPHINTEQNSAYAVLRDIDITSHINTEKNVAYSLLTPQSSTTTPKISSSRDLALYEEIQL